jgi:uncharacterized glyoxalase superfamily protein PhnB
MPTKKKTAKKKTALKKTAAKKTASKKTARARKSASKPRAATTKGLQLRSAAPGLTVNDLDKSLSWYCDVLGFTVDERWEDGGKLIGASLVAGDVTFYIGQDDWKKGRDRKKGEGFRMYCETSQDVDGMAEQIKARGGTLAEEPHDQPWGGRSFAVEDPDGFKITITT